MRGQSLSGDNCRFHCDVISKVPYQKLLRPNSTVGFCRYWSDFVGFWFLVNFVGISSDFVWFGRSSPWEGTLSKIFEFIWKLTPHSCIWLSSLSDYFHGFYGLGAMWLPVMLNKLAKRSCGIGLIFICIILSFLLNFLFSCILKKSGLRPIQQFTPACTRCPCR